MTPVNSGDNIEADALGALYDFLWGISRSAEIAAQMLELGDIRGCIYAVRRLRAYDDAAVTALKIISDRIEARKAGAAGQARDHER